MLALPTSLMGWVSYLNRAATTNYLCCGQALEDSPGAGRIGLTHIFCKDTTNFRICKISVYKLSFGCDFAAFSGFSQPRRTTPATDSPNSMHAYPKMSRPK